MDANVAQLLFALSDMLRDATQAAAHCPRAGGRRAGRAGGGRTQTRIHWKQASAIASVSYDTQNDIHGHTFGKVLSYAVSRSYTSTLSVRNPVLTDTVFGCTLHKVTKTSARSLPTNQAAAGSRCLAKPNPRQLQYTGRAGGCKAKQKPKGTQLTKASATHTKHGLAHDVGLLARAGH